MQLAEGVTTIGLEIQMWRVLAYADLVWRDLGQELVVTSAREPRKFARSLHPFGYAVDLRINYFTKSEALQAQKTLQNILGYGYDVILKSDHIHVEYDKILEDLKLR